MSDAEALKSKADGFFMIPVGENGVLNKIVLTDGKYNAYSIDTIIEIALNNETALSVARENIYASEYKGIPTKTNELFKVHYGKDFKHSDFRKSLNEGLQDSNGKQNGTGSGRKTKFSLKREF